MPVEFISATHLAPASGGIRWGSFDVDYTRKFVHALEDNGFDWTLVPYGSPSADSLHIGQFIVNNSERIKPVFAHRPGFQYPTQFAKALSIIDNISGGRGALHLIAGAEDVEQQREGDFTTKEQRYRRAEEFVDILQQIWTSDGPISHKGEFYEFKDFFTDLKPVQEHFPISYGGSSQQAYEIAGRQADIFGLWGEPLAETREQIEAVNAQADIAGRPHPRIWVSFRPIVAATDDLAWEKARQVLARTTAAIDQQIKDNDPHGIARVFGVDGDKQPPAAVGVKRLRDLADRGELHDRALWTPLAKTLRGQGSTTALVGSYETVAAALVDYVEIGAELLSIRGWDEYNDAVDYGRYVLPLVREELAHRRANGTHPVLNSETRAKAAA